MKQWKSLHSSELLFCLCIMVLFLRSVCLQAVDLSKPIDKRIYKGTQPTCHDFNQYSATAESVALIVGFSAGQVQYLDPIKKETSKLFNEEVLYLPAYVCAYLFSSVFGKVAALCVLVIKASDNTSEVIFHSCIDLFLPQFGCCDVASKFVFRVVPLTLCFFVFTFFYCTSWTASFSLMGFSLMGFPIKFRRLGMHVCTTACRLTLFPSLGFTSLNLFLSSSSTP